jgi:hypothetical protein
LKLLLKIKPINPIRLNNITQFLGEVEKICKDDVLTNSSPAKYLNLSLNDSRAKSDIQKKPNPIENKLIIRFLKKIINNVIVIIETC